MSALPLLRARAGVSVQDVATELGVGRQTVYDWERGATEPGASHLRGLALILGCSVTELLNGRTPPSRVAEWLKRWEEVPRFASTAQVRFAGGGGYEYPLSKSARAQLLSGFKARQAPWLGTDVFDRRIVFFNLAAIDSLHLTRRRVVSPYAKQDDYLVAEALDGRRLYVGHSEESAELVSLLLTITEEPESVVDVALMNEWLVCLGREAEGGTLYHRLGALRLIEVALEPYRAALEAATPSSRPQR